MNEINLISAVSDFPFLDHSIMPPPTSPPDQCFSKLYFHIFHKSYPSSLFFIGMPHILAPGPSMECQVKAVEGMLKGRVDAKVSGGLHKWMDFVLQDLPLLPTFFWKLNNFQFSYVTICEALARGEYQHCLNLSLQVEVDGDAIPIKGIHRLRMELFMDVNETRVVDPLGYRNREVVVEGDDEQGFSWRLVNS